MNLWQTSTWHGILVIALILLLFGLRDKTSELANTFVTLIVSLFGRGSASEPANAFVRPRGDIFPVLTLVAATFLVVFLVAAALRG